MSAAKAFRNSLDAELQTQLEPFLDERGRAQEPFRAVVRRITDQHERRLRRAEREFLDLALMSLAAYFRDVAAAASGAATDVLINIDLPVSDDVERWSAADAALAMGAVEETRADLADETNLNARLVLERLFLRLSERTSAGAGAVVR
jgi:hypothetical protein